MFQAYDFYTLTFKDPTKFILNSNSLQYMRNVDLQSLIDFGPGLDDLFFRSYWHQAGILDAE